jgi:hypothetical protein
MTKIGPFPIVTEQTITEPGWYWFEPACPGMTGGYPKFVQVDQDAISYGWLKCLKYAGKYAGPIEPPDMASPVRVYDHEGEQGGTFTEQPAPKVGSTSLALQNAVNKSLGTNPDLLVEQIVRIITRLRCGCICQDCTRHGSYIVGDLELAAAMICEQTIHPKGVKCDL